jgi:hypothetical protein
MDKVSEATGLLSSLVQGDSVSCLVLSVYLGCNFWKISLVIINTKVGFSITIESKTEVIEIDVLATT